MRFGKLNPRQCRAIVALADRALSHDELETMIGKYATNTIKALAAKGFIAAAGDAGVVQLTDTGRAMAQVLEPRKHRHQAAALGAHA